MAQNDIKGAFEIFLSIAPQYRNIMTLADFEDYLAGKEEAITRFPLPATVWASLQEAIQLYQLARTISRNA